MSGLQRRPTAHEGPARTTSPVGQSLPCSCSAPAVTVRPVQHAACRRVRSTPVRRARRRRRRRRAHGPRLRPTDRGLPPPTDDETTQRDHAVSGTSRSGRHSSRLLSGDAGPTPVGRRGGKDTLGQRRRGHPGRRREEVAGELPGERPEKVVIRRQEAWSLRGTSIRILQGSAQRNVVRRHADHHQHMRTRSPAPPGPQALQSAQEELADEARNGTPVQKRQPPAASRVPSPGSDVRSLEPTLRLSRLLRGRTAC